MARGLRIVRDNRRQAAATVRAQAARLLNDGARELLRKANERVPIEEHVLEHSGHVIEASASELTAAVGYGGEAKAYALRQHEDTTLRHDPGREAKWLENTFKSDAKRVLEWVGQQMRRRTS